MRGGQAQGGGGGGEMDRYSWRVLVNDLLLKQQQIHSVKNRPYYLCFGVQRRQETHQQMMLI